MRIEEHRSAFVADRLPGRELRGFQERRLRIALERASCSALYRRKWSAAGVDPGRIRSLEDLGRLPFTTKEELRREPLDVLAVPREEVAQVHASTGTIGGRSIYTFYTLDDLYVNEVIPRMPNLLPLRSDDFVLNALPYEMSVSAHAFHRGTQLTVGPALLPVGKGGAYSEPAKTLEIARDLAATVYVSTPTYLAHLAEQAVALGIKPGIDLRPRLLLLTGEGCSEQLRQRLSRTWSCEARRYYGSLECGLTGVECGEQNGFHMTSWVNHVEIVEPEGDRGVPAGEVGEVVVTTLNREGSPLLRFRSGDLGFVSADACPCGLPSRLLHLRGRVVDEVPGAGRTWSVVVLEEIVLGLEGTTPWFRLVLEDDRTVLELEPAAGLDVGSRRQLAITAADRLSAILGDTVDVELGPLPRPTGKYRRVVDRRTTVASDRPS